MEPPLTGAKFVLSCGTLSQLPPPSLPEFALVGRSNVGKSTLINRLTNRKSLARTSSVPGKTVTINFYETEGFYLVDLPGYGYAKASHEERERLRRLLGGYLRADREIRLVVQLLDMRHAPSDFDLAMTNLLIDEAVPFVIVFTKADKLSAAQRAARFEGFAREIPCYEDITRLSFSAVTLEGRDALLQVLRDAAGE